MNEKQENQEEDQRVIFDEPRMFDIDMRFIGVSDKPDEVEAVVDACVEECVRRGLFYETGFVQIKHEDNLVVRPGSDVEKVLKPEGGVIEDGS